MFPALARSRHLFDAHPMLVRYTYFKSKTTCWPLPQVRRTFGISRKIRRLGVPCLSGLDGVDHVLAPQREITSRNSDWLSNPVSEPGKRAARLGQL